MLPISIVEKQGFKQMLESFDPRYQLPSRKHFSKITIPALFNSISAIKERISQEGLEYATDSDNNSTSATSTTESAETSPPPKKRTLGSILKKRRETQQPKTPEEKMKVELDSYLSVGVLDSESNPLDWWNAEHHNYPLLWKLAKKYLCICASSAASERLFSSAGNVVTPKRSCLKPEKVNMLVFLAKNL